MATVGLGSLKRTVKLCATVGEATSSKCGCFRPAGKIKLDFCVNCGILVAVMRDNERAISEGIRKRAEKGGDMSVLSVLPWLKDEKRAVTCCGCGCESTITIGEALEWDDISRWQCWECE